jgi:hypothetical protein
MLASWERYRLKLREALSKEDTDEAPIDELTFIESELEAIGYKLLKAGKNVASTRLEEQQSPHDIICEITLSSLAFEMKKIISGEDELEKCARFQALRLAPILGVFRGYCDSGEISERHYKEVQSVVH